MQFPKEQKDSSVDLNLKFLLCSSSRRRHRGVGGKKHEKSKINLLNARADRKQ
jgi:hypothetical protein